jgi:hypothetical protein
LGGSALLARATSDRSQGLEDASAIYASEARDVAFKESFTDGLVRTLLSEGRGHRFESRRVRIPSRRNHVAFENDGQMRHKLGILGSDERGEGTALWCAAAPQSLSSEKDMPASARRLPSP